MLGTVLVVEYIVVPTVIQRRASWNNVPYRSYICCVPAWSLSPKSCTSGIRFTNRLPWYR